MLFFEGFHLFNVFEQGLHDHVELWNEVIFEYHNEPLPRSNHLLLSVVFVLEPLDLERVDDLHYMSSDGLRLDPSGRMAHDCHALNDTSFHVHFPLFTCTINCGR